MPVGDTGHYMAGDTNHAIAMAGILPTKLPCTCILTLPHHKINTMFGDINIISYICISKLKSAPVDTAMATTKQAAFRPDGEGIASLKSVPHPGQMAHTITYRHLGDILPIRMGGV